MKLYKEKVVTEKDFFFICVHSLYHFLDEKVKVCYTASTPCYFFLSFKVWSPFRSGECYDLDHFVHPFYSENFIWSLNCIPLKLSCVSERGRKCDPIRDLEYTNQELVKFLLLPSRLSHFLELIEKNGSKSIISITIIYLPYDCQEMGSVCFHLDFFPSGFHWIKSKLTKNNFTLCSYLMS